MLAGAEANKFSSCRTMALLCKPNICFQWKRRNLLVAVFTTVERNLSFVLHSSKFSVVLGSILNWCRCRCYFWCCCCAGEKERMCVCVCVVSSRVDATLLFLLNIDKKGRCAVMVYKILHIHSLNESENGRLHWCLKYFLVFVCCLGKSQRWKEDKFLDSVLYILL